jgi:hypothetical protein
MHFWDNIGYRICDMELRHAESNLTLKHLFTLIKSYETNNPRAMHLSY